MKEETAERQSHDKMSSDTNLARGEGMLVRILFFLLVAAEAMWGTYFTGKCTANRSWLETCAVYLGLFLLGTECALFCYEEYHRRDGECEELEEDDEFDETSDESREEKSEAGVTDHSDACSTSRTNSTQRDRSDSITSTSSCDDGSSSSSDTAHAAPVEY
jgi:hypothetical protein